MFSESNERVIRLPFFIGMTIDQRPMTSKIYLGTFNHSERNNDYHFVDFFVRHLRFTPTFICWFRAVCFGNPV